MTMVVRDGAARLGAAIVVTVAAALTAAGVAGAATVEEVCDQAQALNAAALPQQALDLVDRLRGTTEGGSATPTSPAPDDQQASCSAERNESLRRIALAAQLAAQASLAEDLDAARAEASPTTAAAATDGPDPVTAAEQQLQPQVCLAPPPDASPLAEAYVAAALACDAENEAAQALAASDPTTGPQAGAKQWDDIMAEYLTAQQSRVLAALALLTVLVVASRLLTRAFPVRGSLSSGLSRLLTLGGAGLIGLSVWFGTAGWGSQPPGTYWPRWGVYAVVCGVAGSTLLAWVWARRRRITVTVTDHAGTENKAASAQVVALLSELGAEAPRGLEVARASDTTALQTAGLAATPEGKVAAAVYRLLELLVPLSPWRVRVEVTSLDLHTVTVTRNGRHVTTALVDRNHLGLNVPLVDKDGKPRTVDGKPVLPDLHRMSAAAALCALKDGFDMPGLVGATHWRSVGWHYVATTDLRRTDAGIDLLVRAVSKDPGNLLAQQALWSYRYRDSTKYDELDMYLSWLTSFIAKVGKNGEAAPGQGAALLRAMHAQVAVAVNLAYLPDGDKPVTRELAQQRLIDSDTKKLHTDLAAVVQKLAGQSGADADFAKSIAGNVEALGWSARRPDTPRPEPSSNTMVEQARTPVTAYQTACYFASNPAVGKPEPPHGSKQAGGDPPDGEADARRAVQYLRVADVSTDLARWRTKDPQLNWLRSRSPYRAAFGRDTETDLLSLQPFAPHRNALRRLAATSPTALSAYADSPKTLAALLSTTPAAATQLIGAATLAASVPSALNAWRVEITKALLDVGVATVTPQTHPGLANTLLATLGTGESPLRDLPPYETLAAWLHPPAPLEKPSRLNGFVRDIRRMVEHFWSQYKVAEGSTRPIAAWRDEDRRH